MQYGVAAALQAFKDTAIAVTEQNAPRIGVLMGAGIGGLGTIEETQDAYNAAKSPKKISPFFIPSSIINMVSGHVSILCNLKGPNLAVVTACTTSTHAIGLAARLIQYRRRRRHDRGRRRNGDHAVGCGRLCAIPRALAA